MHADVRLEHGLLAVESEHEVNAMLELAAPEPPEGGERPPLRLALVLDRSGSMAGDKLAVARRCAAWLVSRLRSQDELALVAYDDEVNLLAPLGQVDGQLERAIASIPPGGSTNLSGGWLRGLAELRGSSDDGVRKILLLTDGLANVGITEPDALVSLTRSAQRNGIGTTTIGFGDDFDEQLLTAMADAGGGNAHYAPTPDAAPAIFAHELEGLTRIVAQNVTVEIRPRDEVEVVAVLNEYPAVETREGIQLELGDAYGGQRARVVFRLHIPHLAALGPRAVADVLIRYVSVGDEIAEHSVTVPVVANAVSAAEAAAAAPDAEVREEVLVLKAARARDEAVRLADAGDFRGAEAVVAMTAAELRASGLTDEAVQLDDLRPVSYDAASRKRLHYEANARRRRRRAS